MPLSSPGQYFRTSLLGWFAGAFFSALTWEAGANLTFVFDVQDGTSQEAVDAFTQAGQMWSDKIADNITIRLSIGFAPLPIQTIGQTSIGYYAVGAPTYTELKAALAAHATSADDLTSLSHMQSGSSYSRLINHTSEDAGLHVDSMDWVGLTLSNARALGFNISNPSAIDGSIVFNSLHNFDLTHDSIDAGAYDFVGAAVHEIGHVLGFVSGVDDIDTGDGSELGSNFSSNMIDLFRYSVESLAAGPGYLDYAADLRAKYFSIDGGATAIAAFSTGVVYGDGNQASHWKDNLGLGIMDPTASLGEKLGISATDLRMVDVLGYSLVVPEPATGLVLSVGMAVFGEFGRFRTRRPR